MIQGVCHGLWERRVVEDCLYGDDLKRVWRGVEVLRALKREDDPPAGGVGGAVTDKNGGVERGVFGFWVLEVDHADYGVT